MKKIITTVLGNYLNTTAFLWPRLAARQGFQLLCYPFPKALKEHHRAFLNTADMFEFYYDDIRIQGYRWGHGPKKVLFLHGWQSHSFRWKNYIESLSPTAYTVYAIDAPGHGLSGGNQLHVVLYSAVICKLIASLEEVHAVISHSMGCFAILHALHIHPLLPVHRLTLLAPPREARDFLALFKKELNLSDRLVNVVQDYLEKEVNSPIDFFSTVKFASSLKIPGLIIHDKDDHDTPYQTAVEIRQLWKNSQLRSTQGLFHNLRSSEVVEEVTHFINQELSPEEM